MPTDRPLVAAETTKARPSMRDIAALAGVSAMTVSKALRNSSKVSSRTRTRIVRIAAALGYRPDPEVSKLMTHLRRRAKPGFQGLICALTDRPATMDHPYIDALVEGARARALERGFAFDVQHFEAGADERRGLRRILKARGVQGIMILPLREPQNISNLLDWRDYSVVAATSSVTAPLVHRVMPHQYANMLKVCEKLAERGCRRIGLAIDPVQDLRVNQAFSAAVVWHNFQARGVVIPPLILTGNRASLLRAWFAREKPDALIASDHFISHELATILGLKVGGPVQLACTSTPGASGAAGMDELPSEIGAMAADRLVTLIQNFERGLPLHATFTLLEGHWSEGTVPPGQIQAKRRKAGRSPS